MSKYGTFLNQHRLTKEEYYQYQKQNKKFTDELYPPNDTSIYSQTLSGEFRDKRTGQKLKESLDSLLMKDDKKLTIEWERISDRPYYNTIYNEKISHEQIEQGSLGDCYLISLLASISHFPELLIGKKEKDTPHVLYNYDFGDIGYYEIMFFIDGEYKIVIIDDYIPFVKDKGIIIFANSSENYFWVNLVEKAYAKICGGYTSMDLLSMEGNKNKECFDHFQVFTGFKCKKYPFYDEKENKFILNKTKANDVLKIIEENLSEKNNKKKFNTMITTGTPDENKGIYLEENYIPYQHSFSIFDFKKIKINKNKDEMILLLLNNPWGRNVYNEGIGPYCLENINENSINLKPYIEYNLHSEDGCFWIDYESFLKNYISISVCKIPCNYFCINFDLKEKENYELPLLYKLKIEKKSNIFFNINMNLSNEIRNGNDCIYLMKMLIINKIDDTGKIIQTYNHTVGVDDMQINYDLDIGNYIIWLYLPKRYFPESNKINAHFMVSSENKFKIDFLDYDIDFNYIINLSKVIFEQKNQKKMNEKEDKMIKCIVDCKSLDGLLFVYFANNTTDKKIEIEPETECDGFSPLNYKENINFKKLNTTLLPGENIYIIGISSLKKSVFSVEKINMKYSESNEKKSNINQINFSEYLNKKINTNIKIPFVKYRTNSYCFIRTNFNKNQEKRDEDKIFNFFMNLMTEKLKSKNLSQEKIKLISKNAWNKMNEQEKEKIIQKYDKKKKELKNTLLKMQVLKYIKRNSVNLQQKKLNPMDNDIINMKIKTRLSHQFQFAKFEDDLDMLEIKIKNILPKIDYLKNTEKDEIELDKYIDKQNKISTELKKLMDEKITIETGEKIDKKKFELLKEYEPLYKKMFEYFKKHDEKMKLYNEINKEGALLLDAVKEQVDIYNTKKLNLKKELNNLIEKFYNLMDEIKKLKLIQINEKCNNEVKKAQAFLEDIKKIQNKLINFVDELHDNIKNKQNEFLPKEKFESITNKQNGLNDTLNKLKETDNDYNYLITLIKEENDLIKNCENVSKSLSKENIENNIKNLENYEKQIKQLVEKVNNFQTSVKNIVGSYNSYIKETNDIRKEITEIYNKFKENKIPTNENMKTVVEKLKELDDKFKALKVNELLEKNKNELLANWNKVNETFNELCQKIKSLKDKDKEKKVNKQVKNNINNNKGIDKEKIKEIKDKVNKDLSVLEKEQSEIRKKCDTIKGDKNKIIADFNNLSKEEENVLNDIKKVFNNDIKNITLKNVQGNLEKYKTFNEKYKELVPKINKMSESCKSLFDSYNSFIKLEEDNRKKIYENVNILYDNKIGADEKIEKILKTAKDIFNDIDKMNINDLNGLFKNQVISKFKEIQNIMSIISQIGKK